MYSLILPPDLVARLYRLREDHQRGPIRRQVIAAVQGYLAEAEAAIGVHPEQIEPQSSTPEPTTSGSKARVRGS